jgi:hypothetical protein
LIPELEKLAAEYVAKALHEIGWNVHAHSNGSSIAEKLGVVPQHRRLLGRLLEIMQDEQQAVSLDDPKRIPIVCSRNIQTAKRN